MLSQSIAPLKSTDLHIRVEFGQLQITNLLDSIYNRQQNKYFWQLNLVGRKIMLHLFDLNDQPTLGYCSSENQVLDAVLFVYNKYANSCFPIPEHRKNQTVKHSAVACRSKPLSVSILTQNFSLGISQGQSHAQCFQAVNGVFCLLL